MRLDLRHSQLDPNMNCVCRAQCRAWKRDIVPRTLIRICRGKKIGSAFIQMNKDIILFIKRTYDGELGMNENEVAFKSVLQADNTEICVSLHQLINSEVA